VFEELSKLYELVEWQKDVIVMEDLNISIKPPYQKENVEGKVKKSVTMV
jgi:hypothetical protein